MPDIVSAFILGEEVEDLAAELPEGLVGSSGSVAEEFFELAEGHFDGVEVGRVGRQVADLGSDAFDGLDDASHFVAGEVVHDDHVARPQRRREMLFDPTGEELAVDGSLNAERRDEARRTHRPQEGRRLPAGVRNLRPQPASARAASVGPRHVGLGPGLVDEDDSIGIQRQLLGRPLPTRQDDVLAILLDGDQRLFFRVRRNARQARLSVMSETCHERSASAAACNSRR